MKKLFSSLFLILSILTNVTSQEMYKDRWNEIENLEKKGLPKSAIAIVDEILIDAKKKGNTNEVIKALLYQSKYNLQIEENARLEIIKNFKTEISKSKFPEKNILTNVLANLYWQYFKQNRYKFYDRTKTAQKTTSEDFRTWDLETLFHEIHCKFEESLSDKEKLQQESLQDYKTLLNTVENSIQYRPTLFDLLAHQALDFYKTPENSITQPIDAFEIDQPAYLHPHPEFAKTTLQTTDTLSLQFKALALYQELTSFHLKNKNSKPLIALTTERLDFVRDNSVFENKDVVFLNTLQREKELHKNTPQVTDFYFEEAQLYEEQAQKFQTESDSAYQGHFNKALTICKEAIDLHPNSTGAKNCKVLATKIKLPLLSGITTNSYTPINTPSRLLFSYKNIDELHIRVHKMNREQQLIFRKKRRDQDKLSFIKSLPVVTSYKVALTNEKDYQQHTTEKILPELPQGMYLITASQTEALAVKKYAYGTVQSTNIALTENKLEDTIEYRITDRSTGKPLNKAQIQLSSNDRRRETLNTTLITDNNGIASFSGNKNFSNITAKVTYQEDTAFFNGLYSYSNYSNRNRNEEQVVKRTTLFTDRSIYRPGQTVYFKGISFSTSNNKEYKALMNRKGSIELRNVNGETVSEINVVTNAYGSFSGKFVLPKSGLTGTYTIEGPDDSYHSISVEEYKRPKFSVEFKPVTKSYRLDDTVSLDGNASAYSGSVLSNSKVTYRVTRKVQYPIWCYWRPTYNSKSQEITFGETITDENGDFTIDFKAIADKTVDQKEQPIFTYEVVADVTDINGETRSATTLVKVGYHTITARIEAKNKIDVSKEALNISISTQNLNDQPVDNTGFVKIDKLKAPDRILIDRSWPAPDYAGIDKNEFYQKFPHTPYKNEEDLKTWSVEKEVYQEVYDTRKKAEDTIVGTDQLKVNTKKWEEGNYRITLETKDPYGQPVKDVSYLKVENSKVIKKKTQEIFSIRVDKDSYQPGEEAIVTLQTGLDELDVVLQIHKQGERVEKQFLTLTKNSKTLKIPVSKTDLGGIAISYSYVIWNSFKSYSQQIKVPYPETDLQISTKTFRNLLEPGGKETWSFLIKGPKGESVATEVLASMYDMSLDQFKSHEWQFDPIRRISFSPSTGWSAANSFNPQRFVTYYHQYRNQYQQQQFDSFNWFGFSFGRSMNTMRFKSNVMMRSVATPEAEVIEEVADEEMINETSDSSVVIGYGVASGVLDQDASDKKELPKAMVPIRKNLQETAFFFPKLETDAEGNVSFSFTSPEALTRWKLQLVAHTKTLESATASFETVTQKELMVLPNIPRFLRQGDEVVITSKISNLSAKSLAGNARLLLTNPITNQPISLIFSDKESVSFDVKASGNTAVSWTLKIPENLSALQYVITASAGDFSDGVQGVLPVVTNRKLVTETLPMWVGSDQTNTFTLDKLKNTNSKTLTNHRLTFEVTSNPSWYAIQALPYLQEVTSSNCSEQVFSRFYGNALGHFIVTQNPRIQQVFDQWKNSDALVSALEKNQELKEVLLSETPWLRDAESETEQKKRIALLFDQNNLQNELQASLRKLKDLQYNSGAFPWFEGGLENRYITQHIIAGFGHLQKLGVTDFTPDQKIMIQKALQYLDKEFLKDYEELLVRKANNPKMDLTKDHLDYNQLHYLYVRSYFDTKLPAKGEEALTYYLEQAATHWLEKNLYSQGLITLLLHRNNRKDKAGEILKSLKERSITNKELGMYWKSNTSGWFWYQAPVETQALLIEVFDEVYQKEDKVEIVDNLKIWLLKNKQTNRWPTTKATTEAVYALLSHGSDWLSITDKVSAKVGKTKIDMGTTQNQTVEAGTGYFKTFWLGTEVVSKQAEVTLTKKGKGIAWGALYWQYFEDLDKITGAKTNLTIDKKLFIKSNTASGPQLKEIKKDLSPKIGDLVTVRMVITSDRNLQFVHMKDMRASTFEPTTVLSGYKYQDGLGYYQSIKDVSTDFFFDYLPKGTYVFEYDVRVTNLGDFSNGITTIQSMYAPELSSHSEGVRLQVEK
ncbi:MG2 domain-containing protein [Aquimarina sp. ERC-38]|uniref:alpha-2-macroglobulin family protein n=1 Tax=Aquimarina sp. ERC-38 TaxID=2949996 RepID=UPI0022479FAC|nr:MG2 domain-containing protein [Aquimarina sp. ERC-38]UZO82484.1 MG2 domain-containing protein [Aquimarina sp. ERC-38]